MDAPAAAATLLASYALGSVSFAYLAAKLLRGVNLREVGSGNLGATNASRVLGRKWGVAIYLLDFLKGFAPALLVRSCAGDPRLGGPDGPPLAACAGLAAFVGHCYPAWHGFRGGKGVATASGLVLALSPWAGLTAFAVFGALVAAFRFISVGSVAAAAALPFAHVAFGGVEATLTGGGRWITGLFALIAAWVIVRHRSNLRRVLAGEEPKVGKRK